MEHFGPESFKGAKKLTANILEKASKFAKDESSGGKLPSKGDFEKGARAALIAGAALAVPTGTAEAQVHSPQKKIEHVKEVGLSENEIDLLAQNVYHEARGEPLQGQLAVLQVTLARLASGKFDRGKGLVDGVIFAPNQFSWTNDPKILLSKTDEGGLANIRTIISLFVARRSAKEAVRLLTEQTNLPQNTYFYKRTDWNEDDPEEKRMSSRTKKMFQSLTPVGEIGNHTFYTDIRPSAPRRTAGLN